MIIINPNTLNFLRVPDATGKNQNNFSNRFSNFLFENEITVFVAMGNVPFVNSEVRIIRKNPVDGLVRGMQLPLYKLVVWDAITENRNMSYYFVSRDAPVLDEKNPKNVPWFKEETFGSTIGNKTTYNIINTAFEPSTQ